jgi:malonyl-CoA O-methyltransferase
MVPIKAIDRRRLRSNFSAHADEYDTFAAVQKRVIQHLCEQLVHFELSPGPLMDIGTGTGALATALHNNYPEQPLLVMDIAHGMTRAASQRLPLVMACDGDARSLPFTSGAFANIMSSSVYQWVDNLPSAFTEVARALKPEGSFALALFGEQTLQELRSAHRSAVKVCGQQRPSHVQTFPTRTEVATALATAGLHIQALVSHMEVEFHTDVPDLLRQLKHIGASNAAADRPRGLASRRVMQTMMELYEERYRTEQGLPASYEVIIAVSKKETFSG